MKKASLKIASVCIVLSLLSAAATVYPFAKTNDFISDIFPNIVKAGEGGKANLVKLQDKDKSVKYYRVSWLRSLIVKEDIMTAEGAALRASLVPVASYPYTYTSASFKKEVDSYVKLYTIDENSQKAAYLYFFKQIDAMSLISDPNITDKAKIQYLKDEGIVVPDGVESDSTQMLMAGALYAYMTNDLYYVFTGNPESDVVIPYNTPLEEALLIYTIKLTGQQNTVMDFTKKYFGITKITSLDEYIFYTSLYALWTKGLVRESELSSISGEEVYRRLTLMEIREQGITISDGASMEDIKMAYLAAGLGKQYNVTINYTKLKAKYNENKIPFYILQLMITQDKGLYISETQYSYSEAFDFAAKKTDRFKLDNDFYADIYEYDINLDYKRSQIYLRTTPLTPDLTPSATNKTTVKVRVFLADGTELPYDDYCAVKLSDPVKETVKLVVKYFKNGTSLSSTTYKLNFVQGSQNPPKTAGVPDTTGAVPVFPNTTGSGNTFGDSDIATSDGSVSVFESEVLNQMYSTDINGNYVDADGNIITSFGDGTLPDGYAYTVYRDGSIGIVPAAQSTSFTEAGDGSVVVSEGGSLFGKITSFAGGWEKGVIIAAFIAMAGLLAALFIVVYKRKKDYANEHGGEQSLQ